MKKTFDHEKLDVYQEASRFVAWADEILETVPKNLAVHGELDRASRVHEDRGSYGSVGGDSPDYD